MLNRFYSTDEDPGLRIESFAIIKLRGVSTKLNIIVLYCGFIYLLFLLWFYIFAFSSRIDF